ncbi:hypothetical protein HHL17_12930 [Chitinophaga sp. G-6-1-13]|uniref:DUF3575 domain-containing protein n=1 Tax=Chitinophaga fulva TaxID=2728842 RepID=A0A848GMA7_9BACT|nr:hypothetical protein [Chitinophaga fulva]NML38102.1 hypothetical protein [Chitinophaga fulva]
MTKLIAVALLSTLPLTTAAQKDSLPDNGLKPLQIKGNLMLPGIGFSLERKLSHRTSLHAEMDLVGYYYYTYSDYYGGDWGYELVPVARLEERFYYNLRKRLARGKSMRNNSGNFFAISGSYFFGTVANRNMGRSQWAFSLQPLWGMQRGVGKHFSFDARFGLGPVYYSDLRRWEVQPRAQLMLGYVIK